MDNYPNRKDDTEVIIDIESNSSSERPQDHQHLISKTTCADYFRLIIDYWIFRWSTSKLRKIYHLNNVRKEDLERAIDTIAVLNGLFLTIPFSLMGSLNQEFWDWYEETVVTCATHIDWIKQYNTIVNSLYSVVFCVLVTLTLATLYYLLRPDEEKEFLAWWPRAKWVVIIIILSTVVSVWNLFNLFDWVVEIYVQSTNHLCGHWDEESNRYFISNGIGYTVYGCLAGYALLVML